MKTPETLADQMPLRRFEYTDDRSYKFWAIELDGDSHTVTFGRISTKGQTRTKQYDSAAEAKREYQKRIKEKLRAGYREVEKKTKPRKTDEQIAAERAPHEPFLEAIIEAHQDDLTPHLIYSDWLTERGDPLGEFIQVQIQLEDPNLPLYRRPELEKRETQLFARHVREWLGDLAPFLIDQRRFGDPQVESRKNYEFLFQRGQLYSIDVETFDLMFGAALRRSWRCRLLSELKIVMTRPLEEELTIDCVEYEAWHDHGLATFSGADFSSLFALFFPSQMNIGRTEQFLADLTNGVVNNELPRLLRLSLPVYAITSRLATKLPQLQSLELGHLTAGNVDELTGSELFGRLREILVATRLHVDVAHVLAATAHLFSNVPEFHVSRDTSNQAIRIMRDAGYTVTQET